MAKVVRPLRFDNMRKMRRNQKRREARRRHIEAERSFSRPFNQMFWFGIEPERMWDTLNWEGNGANDNDENL